MPKAPVDEYGEPAPKENDIGSSPGATAGDDAVNPESKATPE